MTVNLRRASTNVRMAGQDVCVLLLVSTCRHHHVKHAFDFVRCADARIVELMTPMNQRPVEPESESANEPVHGDRGRKGRTAVLGLPLILYSLPPLISPE